MNNKKKGKTIQMSKKPSEDSVDKESKEYKQEMDEKEIQKIQFEQEQKVRQYIAARKKHLKQQLELLRLEHEFVKLQVEHYQYSSELDRIRKMEEEIMKEQEEKKQAAASAKATEKKGKSKIVTPDKTLTDVEGNPIKKEK